MSSRMIEKDFGGIKVIMNKLHVHEKVSHEPPINPNFQTGINGSPKDLEERRKQ